MPLDPACANLLAALAAASPDQPPLEQMTPAQAREAFAGLALLAGPGSDVAATETREVGGVPARVHTPHGPGPFPVLIWIHGGGWVIGSAQEADAVARDLAAKAHCTVVSLDYRLAPEHKAPAAVDDCLAATLWVLEHAGELGADPARVAVGGDSAGGNLAALVAQHLRDRLVHQVLVYPVTDLRLNHPSIDENGEGYLLTKAGMQWFVHHYLDGSGIDPGDPRVSPLCAANLEGLPPALVITAEFDPLRDEGEAYAARLREAGVPTTLVRYDGMIHGFFQLAGAIPAGAHAIDEVAGTLRAAFATH